jgi:hypothetical protein
MGEGGKIQDRKAGLENIKTYLQIIGVGSRYEETREKIEKEVQDALAGRQEHNEKEAKMQIKKAILESTDPFEPSFSAKDHMIKLYEDKKKGVGIYYYMPSSKKKNAQDSFYVYTPSNIIVQRASEQELGRGVLGVAYVGLNVIKILDTLYGSDFEEVKKHEVLHHQFPHEPEYAIRKRTASEFPGAKYQ